MPGDGGTRRVAGRRQLDSTAAFVSRAKCCDNGGAPPAPPLDHPPTSRGGRRRRPTSAAAGRVHRARGTAVVGDRPSRKCKDLHVLRVA